MKRFVVPPNWPAPPRRSWVPPRTWRPDPDWPPAPEGWRFWVNAQGKPVIGRVGRYAAPSLRAVVGGVGAVVAFISVNLWAVTAVGIFGGSPEPQSASSVAETPSASATATPGSAPTTAEPSTPVPTQVPTTTPTVTPTEPPTSSPSASASSPHSTVSATTTPLPSTTPSPVTAEQLFADLCRKQGPQSKWCDPTKWPPGHRHG